MSHQTETVPHNLSHMGRQYVCMKPIDQCLAPAIKALNAIGAKTAGCCCGHGKNPGSIKFHNGTEIRTKQQPVWKCKACGKSGHEIFQQWLDASSADRNGLFDLVYETLSPHEILEIGFTEYDSTCAERCLTGMIALLERAGEAAWPALRTLANSKREEIEMFVALVAGCRDVPAYERAAVLISWAFNAADCVRREILYNLDGIISEQHCITILKILGADLVADIREEARDLLESY